MMLKFFGHRRKIHLVYFEIKFKFLLEIEHRERNSMFNEKISKSISTSNSKKITAIKKSRSEKDNRADLWDIIYHIIIHIIEFVLDM